MNNYAKIILCAMQYKEDQNLYEKSLINGQVFQHRPCTPQIENTFIRT